MKLPITQHKNIKYRNGESGILLTTVRPRSVMCSISFRLKTRFMIYHDIMGKFCGMKDDHDLDIVEIED